MGKILIVSVGGSAEPVINAIKTVRPDHVYFFCSAGHKGSSVMIDSPGDPCGDKRKAICPQCGSEFPLGNPNGKAIVYQANLEKDRYDVVTVQDPDDLNECWTVLNGLSARIKEIYGTDSRVVANYTGGTKTMSVALGISGLLTDRWDLSVNIGPRMDTIKVRGGDIPVLVEKGRLHADIQIQSVRKAIERFDYAQAHQTIGEILDQAVDAESRRHFVAAGQICRAFDLWDKFQHEQALAILMHHGDKYAPYIVSIKRIIGRAKSDGYEIVGDLLNNAQRKGDRGLFDDAVARLYRLMELMAQIRLKKEHRLDAGNLALNDLPKSLRKNYRPFVREQGRIIFGLRADYELLNQLGDPLGKMYEDRQAQIADALARRNNSINAHGLTPLNEEDYRFVMRIMRHFVENAEKELAIRLTLPQFPNSGIL